MKSDQKSTSVHIPFEAIKHFLPANPVIVEAGAHNGRGTKKLVACWPTATIHSFEPVPALYDQLKQVTLDYKQVTCYPYALSNKTGTASLYVSGGRCTSVSSLLKPLELRTECPDITFDETIEVETITLADWSIRYHIDQVDLLFLDIQGPELNVLKAAGPLLKTVRAIHTEANTTLRYENNPLHHELRSWLEHNGFIIHEERFTRSSWGNILAVRP